MHRNRRFAPALLAMALVPTLSLLADEGHPDIELELENDTELHIHDGPVLHNHEHFEFIHVGGTWATSHDSTTWPGISAESGTFTGSDTFNLIVETPLLYWNGVSGGFESITGGTVMNIRPNGFSPNTFIGGSPSLPIMIPSIAEDTGAGGIHTHPLWTLIGDGGNPADGAYLIGIRIAGANYETSNFVGILFHKGLNEAQYETAEGIAAALIPEPASFALLAAGMLVMLRRRR